MPLTADQIKADRILALDAALTQIYTGNPLDGRVEHLIRQIEQTKGASNVAAGSGSGSADTQAGIDSSTLLADIKAELVNSKAIANILIQDSSPTVRYFIRQDTIDQSTGSVVTSILNLDGTAPNPAPQVPLIPVKAGASNTLTEKLYVVATAGAGYAVGDSVSNLRLLDGTTGTIAVSLWYNITTGSAIASAIPIADLQGYEDRVEELLEEILDTENTTSILLSNLQNALGNQSDIAATSDTAADSLVALIKRLGSKFLSGAQAPAQSLAVVNPIKSTLVGFTTTLAPGNNVNLLDPTGAGSPTNVSAFQSGLVLVKAVVISGGFIIEGSVDAAFTSPKTVWAVANMLTLSTFCPINLQGINFIRVSATNLSIGTTAVAVLNQSPHIANLALSGNVGFRDLPLSAITSSQTSVPVKPQGISYQVEVIVSSVSGTNPTLDIQVQETGDDINWRTIYTFERITTIGTYKSAMLPLTGRAIRYVQIVVGTNAVFARQIDHNESNQPVNVAIGTKRSGGFNILDLPLWGRTRRIVCCNRTGAAIFLQIHNKTTPLVIGDIPVGDVYTINPAQNFVLSVGELGEHGTVFGSSPRIGLSSTFSRYTALTGLAAAPNEPIKLTVESI